MKKSDLTQTILKKMENNSDGIPIYQSVVPYTEHEIASAEAVLKATGHKTKRSFIPNELEVSKDEK
jgi:hypothetical protein